jgi:hypothetical protein
MQTRSLIVFACALMCEAAPAYEPSIEVLNMRMGPPHGSNSSARCPVSGAAINITESTPSLAFKQGQQLYFESSAAAALYRASPRDYWLGPHDMPEPGMDGMRGLPDVRGQILHCPRSGEALNVSMQTPRVMMKNGQAVRRWFLDPPTCGLPSGCMLPAGRPYPLAHDRDAVPQVYFCCHGCVTAFWRDPASLFA